MKEPIYTFFTFVVFGVVSLILAASLQMAQAEPAYLSPLMTLVGLASFGAAVAMPIVMLCNASSRRR